MVKTSIVRKVSVDDVRGIPHLTAIGIMTTDVFDKTGDFNYTERENFIRLINNYIMHCDPLTNSIEYATSGVPHRRVIFEPAGLDGIKIEYHLGVEKRVCTWDYDDYAELSGEWMHDDDDDDDDWYK